MTLELTSKERKKKSFAGALDCNFQDVPLTYILCTTDPSTVTKV